MKIWKLTFKKVEKLREQVKQKEVEVEELEATPPSRIWHNDLDAVEEALDVRDQEIEATASKERKAQKRHNARRVKKEKAKNSCKKKRPVILLVYLMRRLNNNIHPSELCPKKRLRLSNANVRS